MKELWEEGKITHQQDKTRTEMVLLVTALGKPRPANAQPPLPLESDGAGSAELYECPEPTFPHSQGPRSEFQL